MNLPQQQINSIQSLDSKNTIYNTPAENERFLVSTNHSDTSVIFQKRDTSKPNFNGDKNGINPSSNQFTLLISYLYNKSFIREKTDDCIKEFLTEISPNAP